MKKTDGVKPECFICGEELPEKEYGVMWFDYDKGEYGYLCHFDCIQNVIDTMKLHRDKRLNNKEE